MGNCLFGASEMLTNEPISIFGYDQAFIKYRVGISSQSSFKSIVLNKMSRQYGTIFKRPLIDYLVNLK